MEINDYPNYLIYEDGRVWSKTSNRYLKTHLCKNTGYYKLHLSHNSNQKCLSIHRLVALHYIPNPNNYPQIDGVIIV